MRTFLLVLTLLAAPLVVAGGAVATCSTQTHTFDPVPVDTGTMVDDVVVQYERVHCGPPIE